MTVQLYAACRDVFHASELRQVLPPSATAEMLIEALVVREPAFARFAPTIHLAVNDEFAARDRELAEGDVVALLPPVSGG